MMENVHPFQSKTDIGAEARAWVLRFNADTPPTDEDVEALREWCKRSSIHRAELERAEQFWSEADLLSELAVPISRMGSKKKPGFLGEFFGSLLSIDRQGAVTATAFMGLAITVSLWLFSLSGKVGNGIYDTAVGEQTILTLMDGSQIQLDTNSQVHVNYSEGMREIRLLRGKAHFDVAKNPDRPFEVYAGDGFVRAVGTAFLVYLAGSDVQVTVDEGRVDLARVKRRVVELEKLPLKEVSDSGGNHTNLKPSADRDNAGDVFMSLDKGQSVLFNHEKEQLSQLEDRELTKKLAWRRGLLIFTGEPLHKVVAEVSRYTRTHIEISDPELSDLEIGGRFRVGELDALFDVLEVGFGVQISYTDDQHIQLRSSAK